MVHSQLTNVRSELNRLVRMRAAVRFATAGCILASGAIGFLSLLFLVDWMFHLSIESRLFLLLLSLVAIAWMIRRLFCDLASKRETIEDVALAVEKQHGIDSDLIAALQFDSHDDQPQFRTELTQAVIADAVTRIEPLDLFEGFSLGLLPRHATLFVALALLVIAFAITDSASSLAFANRLLLGTGDYPTRTSISSIRVNGQIVVINSDDRGQPIRIPFGHPVKFEIEYSGRQPKRAYVRLATARIQFAEEIELKSSSTSGPAVIGELRRMTESFRSTFYIGDATSQSFDLEVIPLPIVDFAWKIVPPKYTTSSTHSPEDHKTTNQLSVLRGSAVKLSLDCRNKPLKAAKVIVAERATELIPKQSGADVFWTLPPNTLFDAISESFSYEIQVVDQDELSLEHPIAGSVRIKADAAPRLTATAVTEHVLRTAEPKIDYVATDDFGVSKIDAVIDVIHEDSRSATHELAVKAVLESDQPSIEIRGQVAIPLSRYELTKGDSVKVRLRTVDWRGDQPGEQFTSEPITFLVTDLASILSRVNDEDKKAVKQLEEIIKAAGKKP